MRPEARLVCRQLDEGTGASLLSRSCSVHRLNWGPIGDLTRDDCGALVSQHARGRGNTAAFAEIEILHTGGPDPTPRPQRIDWPISVRRCH